MGGSLEQSEGDDIRIGNMSVSRSFGDLDNIFISQEPDVFDYNISEEKFIVMGCDGVWDVLGNQDVVDYVLDKYDELISNNKRLLNLKGKSEYNIAQKVAELAINKGSQDNISITILFFVDNL
jgi:serine/threonine protein phosphatase PrpC